MPYNRRTGEYYPERSNRGRSNYRSNGSSKPNYGCKMGTDKKQRPVITGWNKTRKRGFITMVAVPTKDCKTKSKNSDKWIASVKFADGKKAFTAFYNVNSKKLVIPDLDMVAIPATGYFGTFNKISNRR